MVGPGKHLPNSSLDSEKALRVESEDEEGLMEVIQMVRGPKEFKIALAKYAVKKGFDIVYLRNAKGRIRARCRKDGCPFRISAAVDNSDGFYNIKTFIKTYECSTTFKNKRAPYKFVGEHFLCKIRVIPKLKLIDMQKLANEELKVNLSKGKL
ncbi:hypothetical protein PVK06_010538 [Gossypium arboreum]|uniref:Transposase MuDR plant domain-containing protein n=1 Tax=Gossypium arboreum TaxID=29729 RepID=A0ABR0Q736_GOSAR|nr:hypothetical protein PVK06_010538 [Gossypium arboreum]